MTSASLMHDIAHSEPVLWDNPEGWGGEDGGSGVQEWGSRLWTHVYPWLIDVYEWQKTS